MITCLLDLQCCNSIFLGATIQHGSTYRFDAEVAGKATNIVPRANKKPEHGNRRRRRGAERGKIDPSDVQHQDPQPPIPQTSRSPARASVLAFSAGVVLPGPTMPQAAVSFIRATHACDIISGDKWHIDRRAPARPHQRRKCDAMRPHNPIDRKIKDRGCACACVAAAGRRA